MRRRIRCFSLLVCAANTLGVTAAQAIDAEKWYAAEEIHYLITGEFDGEASIAPEGLVKVRDRVVVELVTDGGGTLKGEIRISNTASQTAGTRSAEQACRAPTLSGPYEHYTLHSLASMADGNILVMAAEISTHYPDVVVPVSCTGGNRTRKAHTEKDLKGFYIPGMGQYLLPTAVFNNDKQTLDPNAGVITVKELGWTWTYKATPR